MHRHLCQKQRHSVFLPVAYEPLITPQTDHGMLLQL